MDSSTSEFKKRGGNDSDNKRGLSKVVYRDYNAVEDKISFHILLEKYWAELFEEDLDKFIWLGGDRPYRINTVEVQILRWLVEDKALVKIAEVDDKIIGFMVYHYFFDSCVVVRGIYFNQEYRLRGLMSRIILSVGHVSRVISQTLSKHDPKEIKGIKKNRALIHESDDFKVWEYSMPRSRRNKNGF